MRHDAPSLSQHRLARLARWIGLMLIAAAACVVAGAGARLRPWLDHLRRGIVALIILRAHALGPRWRAKRRYGPIQMRRAQKRAWIGARLRRTRSKDVRTEISALWTLLFSIEAQAARLARRLRGGLSRRGATHAPPVFSSLRPSLAAPAPFVADTS